MTTTSWHVSGQYYETCSCDFICPCLPAQLAIKPTKGTCEFAMAFQIERGQYGAVSLDGLAFIILGLTPGEMGKGNWSVGLVADSGASAEQRDAITAIADSPGAVVFHCAAGKDRTGLVSAVVLGALGVSDEDIVADYAMTGRNLVAIDARLRPP